jgi:hypothetical protein
MHIDTDNHYIKRMTEIIQDIRETRKTDYDIDYMRDKRVELTCIVEMFLENREVIPVEIPVKEEK